MKKIIIFVFSVFLFAQNLQNIAKSKEFQEYIDSNINKINQKVIKEKSKLVEKETGLYIDLLNNMNKLSDEELANNFVKINNILKGFWLDKFTYANGVYKEGKNIVFEYLIKDDEKMRNKFKDKKFKNDFKKAMEYTQNRRLCHHDKIMDRLLKNGYSIIYRYKFFSNRQKIMDISINEKTCKGF